jgi:hypothetical protein
VSLGSVGHDVTHNGTARVPAEHSRTAHRQEP